MRQEAHNQIRIFSIGLLIYLVIALFASTVFAAQNGGSISESGNIENKKMLTTPNNTEVRIGSSSSVGQAVNTDGQHGYNLNSRGGDERPFEAESQGESNIQQPSNEVREKSAEPVEDESAKPAITNKLSKQEFIDIVFHHAKISQEKTGIPAGIVTAQAALESGYGRYVPIDTKTKQYSYNLFGIKGTGPAGSVSAWTTEYVNGQTIRKVSKFKAYNSFEEAIEGHGEVLKKGKRYSKLFKSGDPKEWAKGLQRAGYASAPDYAQQLIGLINRWELK